MIKTSVMLSILLFLGMKIVSAQTDTLTKDFQGEVHKPQQTQQIQKIVRYKPGEGVLQFVQRQYPQWEVVENQLIATEEFGTETPAIIAYFRKPYFYDGQKSGTNLIGFVWIPQGKHRFREIRIGKIFQEGGVPQILAIFFVNADQDKARELAVLVKWPQRHYDYGGAFYGTKFYDFDKKKKRFTSLSELSDQFFGCECSFRDGRVKHAKYQTAATVREKLEKMF